MDTALASIYVVQSGGNSWTVLRGDETLKRFVKRDNALRFARERALKLNEHREKKDRVSVFVHSRDRKVLRDDPPGAVR